MRFVNCGGLVSIGLKVGGLSMLSSTAKTAFANRELPPRIRFTSA